MPTYNIKKVRKLLKSGRAEICGHEPFTIRLLYETPDAAVQPVEVSVDTGYQYIGISAKSEQHEYISEERKCLTDEKKHHMAQKRYRQARRHRKRYRKPMNRRAANSRHTDEGWLAPSIQHKADLHIRLIKKYAKRFPVAHVTLELGQFDTAVLSAVNEGRPVPEGIGYQHGPKYGFDTLREAVFARDKHKCACCGRSAIKDGRILVLHHIGFRKGNRSNRMGNLLTVCTKCHTAANHKPGGKLWDVKPKGNSIQSAAFMNSVKWYIYESIKAFVPGTHITYGAVTKRERLNRNIVKSHANDAYCIGVFHPKHRAHTVYFKKRRRNKRVLERFYDAKVIDARTGEKVKGAALGCGRTKRSVPRRNENNLRPFRGQKVSKGYRSIRKRRHPIDAGVQVLYKGSTYTVKACRTRNSKTLGIHETVEFKERKGEVPAEKVIILRYAGGWEQTTRETFYGKGNASGR